MFDARVEKALRQGVSFGVISSAMTALGISMAQWSSKGTLKSIIAGIVGLSISNALADAFSIYMSDRATGKGKEGLISAAIVASIEFLVPYIFLVIFLIFDRQTAILINAILGIVLVAVTGFKISTLHEAKHKQTDMTEYLMGDISLYIGITIAIMALTYYSGVLANKLVK